MTLSAAQDSEDPIDIEELWALVGEDSELLRDLIQIFFEDLPAITSALEDAVVRRDALAIFKAAHRIRGALLNFAATPSIVEARSLELLGRSGRVDGASRHLEALQHELARLHVALEELARRGGPIH